MKISFLRICQKTTKTYRLAAAKRPFSSIFEFVIKNFFKVILFLVDTIK